VLINSLIDKYGVEIFINDTKTKAFIDDTKKSYLKGYKEYTDFEVLTVMAKEDISLDDVLKIDDKVYYVFEVVAQPRTSMIYYTEAVVYKDDFTHDIELYDTEPTQNCAIEGVGKLLDTLKVSIKTKSVTDDILMYSGKAVTHIFTCRYKELTSRPKLIKWAGRSFEVLSVVNKDEENKFLSFECVEIADV